MRENEFQSKLIKRLRIVFPGCVILKNDANYIQGIPDLTILHGNMWAMLEVKASANSRSRPNQEYYIELLDGLSFAAFISPETEEEVIRALQSTFASRR